MTHTDISEPARRGKLPDLWAAVLRRHANRSAARHLYRMEDHLLKDIGLTRADIAKLR